MKIDLFVLPSVMRKDFMDAFVLSRDEIFCLYPSLEENLYREGIDPCEWYDTAYLWDKMSPRYARGVLCRGLGPLAEPTGERADHVGIGG